MATRVDGSSKSRSSAAGPHRFDHVHRVAESIALARLHSAETQELAAVAWDLEDVRARTEDLGLNIPPAQKRSAIERDLERAMLVDDARHDRAMLPKFRSIGREVGVVYA